MVCTWAPPIGVPRPPPLQGFRNSPDWVNMVANIMVRCEDHNLD
jgi:hypothetical protein